MLTIKMRLLFELTSALFQTSRSWKEFEKFDFRYACNFTRVDMFILTTPTTYIIVVAFDIKTISLFAVRCAKFTKNE